MGKDRSKFAETTVPGIFLGYETMYGGKWGKGYIVTPLEAFRNVGVKTPPKVFRKQVEGRITVTENVAPVPGEKPWFPLLDRALYANKTLQGLEESKDEIKEDVERAYDGISDELFSNDYVNPDDDDLMGNG